MERSAPRRVSEGSTDMGVPRRSRTVQPRRLSDQPYDPRVLASRMDHVRGSPEKTNSVYEQPRRWSSQILPEHSLAALVVSESAPLTTGPSRFTSELEADRAMFQAVQQARRRSTPTQEDVKKTLKGHQGAAHSAAPTSGGLTRSCSVQVRGPALRRASDSLATGRADRGTESKSTVTGAGELVQERRRFSETHQRQGPSFGLSSGHRIRRYSDTHYNQPRRRLSDWSSHTPREIGMSSYQL